MMIPWLGLQDPVASLTHFAAAAAVLIGTYFLLRKGRGNSLRVASLLLFSASLLFLFCMSGVYHGLGPGPARAFFRRLDYAGIWIVIAGSATPVHLLLLRGLWRWGLTALFWTAALTCLFLFDSYLSTLPYWSIVLGYVGVSMLGAVSISRIIGRYGWREPSLLLLGGAAYAGGAIIDAAEGPVLWNGVLGPHEVFHILVIAGALLHWLFIYKRADRRLPSPRAALATLRYAVKGSRAA
ncbi:MAG: hemolysin III family protein [Elusimicrobia bacterium]|nr:hemolysin III family protein [Elusimicrobiota bacterium]